VIAAGATVLDIQLGGLAIYDHQVVKGVKLGQGLDVISNDILRSIRVVSHSVWLWIALLAMIIFLDMFI
jgi:cobalamin biosynthesis protein CobD/CbiB